jgi:hypothetical protein
MLDRIRQTVVAGDGGAAPDAAHRRERTMAMAPFFMSFLLRMRLDGPKYGQGC